jgi:hypothetical protein
MSQRLPCRTIIEQCLTDGAGPFFNDVKRAIVGDHLESQFASEEVETLDLEVVAAGSERCVVQEGGLGEQLILAVDVGRAGNAQKAPISLSELLRWGRRFLRTGEVLPVMQTVMNRERGVRNRHNKPIVHQCPGAGRLRAYSYLGFSLHLASLPPSVTHWK